MRSTKSLGERDKGVEGCLHGLGDAFGFADARHSYFLWGGSNSRTATNPRNSHDIRVGFSYTFMPQYLPSLEHCAVCMAGGVMALVAPKARKPLAAETLFAQVHSGLATIPDSRRSDTDIA
jgi:hypothetical protein